MSLISFSGERLLYGATPVDNLFLREFLPRASGDAVRVYLYGLYAASDPTRGLSTEEMARALDMEEAAVVSAFAYWERQGLILRTADNPPAYQYQDVRSALENAASQEAYYGLQGFNNRLQAIFGSERLLHPQEFQRAAEWVEDLGLGEEAVLLLVKSRARDHKKVSFKTLDKAAAQWAREGVKSAEDAQRILERDSEAYRLAQQVISCFNLKRNPTEPETALARKWTGEWNLTAAQVLDACRETVKGSNPSFGYVDRILERHHEGDVSASIREDNSLRAAVSEVLRALGARTAPTPEQVEKYQKYLSAGFEPEAVLETARSVAAGGRHDFAALDGALVKCVERGMLTMADIQAYRRKKQEAEAFLSGLGLTRPATDAEAAMLDAWRAEYAPDLIQAAARKAVGVGNPVSYMNALLRRWADKGIRNGEEALRDRPDAAPAPQAQPREAVNYSQRDYTDEEMKRLFMNPEDM